MRALLSPAKLLIGGGVVTVLVAAAAILTAQNQPQSFEIATSKLTEAPKATASINNTTAQSAAKVESRTITAVEVVPYEVTERLDPNVFAERSVTVSPGVDGEKTVVYSVTYDANGAETSRTKISEHVTKEPVNAIVKVGTKPVPAAATTSSSPTQAPTANVACHPNYTNYTPNTKVCVPMQKDAAGNLIDVDCKQGTGSDGPLFVSGTLPVKIINPRADVYGLDGTNKNGIGCE